MQQPRWHAKCASGCSVTFARSPSWPFLFRSFSDAYILEYRFPVLGNVPGSVGSTRLFTRLVFGLFAHCSIAAQLAGEVLQNAFQGSGH
jgi:hypothetical protein